MNNYKKIDLGYGNSLREFSIVNLKSFNNSQLPILVLQKKLKDKVFIDILKNIGIENLDSISPNGKTNFDNSFGRSGFNILETKEYGDIGIILGKGAESTQQFSYVSDFYMGGTDIGDKTQARGLELEEEERILGEILWGYKTELLLLLGRKTLEQIGDISNFELDILTTKFTPTLTKKVIEQLPKLMKKPIIKTVDSNSELNIQIQEILNPKKNIGAIEIVQSGNSLIATDSFVVKDGKIFEPSVRNKESGEFEGNIIGEIDPKSQAGIIANGIQSEVDLALYKIISDKNNKKEEFIKAIQNSMKQF